MEAGIDPVAVRDKAKELLAGVLERMACEATVEAGVQEDGTVLLQVSSPDASRLIGRGAQTLDALQLVLSRMVQRHFGERCRCVVDVELYRERRRDRLIAEAYRAGEEVRATGRPFRFEPLNAAERRIVHQALRDEPGLETESGPPDERGHKRVEVRPVGPPPAAEPEPLPPDDAEPSEEDIIER